MICTGWERKRPFVRDDADPAVRFLLEKVADPFKRRLAEVDAGLGFDTIRVWRYRYTPRIDTLRRALNAIGYDLAIVPFKAPEP